MIVIVNFTANNPTSEGPNNDCPFFVGAIDGQSMISMIALEGALEGHRGP